MEIAGEEKGLLAVSCVLSVISSAFAMVPFISLYRILEELLANASSIATVNANMCIHWAIIGLAGLVISYMFMYFGGMGTHVAAYRILCNIRIRLTNHMGELPLGYFNRNATGKVKKIIGMDVEKIEIFIAHQLPDLFSAVSMILLMIAIMFSVDYRLALAAIIPALAAFMAQYSMMTGKRAQQELVSYMSALENIGASSVQYVRGMPSIKIFGKTVHSFRKFYDTMIAFRDSCIRFTDNFQNGYVTFKVILMALEFFVFPVGLFILAKNPADTAFAATFLFFLVFAGALAAPIMRISALANHVNVISEGVRRIDGILAEPPIPTPDAPQTPTSSDIQFQDVSFSYHKDREVLSGISFTAKAGTITALVGPSGSGKSTIAQLIPRFWDVDKGTICIGGADIRQIEPTKLMQCVSFVFQDSYLFEDTLYHNILLGRPGANRTDVGAAAKAAQCHDFILATPQGYETRIGGTNGVHLSGGEEQRISVARAILKNAPILVLDEATAYADPENEHEMQIALGHLMKDKTVLIIAHRLATIQRANQILVIEKGWIIEQGTHEKLLLENGRYSQMWESGVESSSWKIER